MRYVYQKGTSKKPKRNKKKPLLVLAGLMLVSGLYVLSLLAYPALPVSTSKVSAITQTVKNNRPDSSKNRVYIPKIGVATPIVKINGNEAAALEKGIIERAPLSGNPAVGGNYVLAGHRFDFSYTPKQTLVKSPLYHVEKLAVDDHIYVDYGGLRYDYKIATTSQVSPDDTAIEKHTDEPTLTLYTCQLDGPKQDRIVVVAHPVGVVTWVDGKPGIKAL